MDVPLLTGAHAPFVLFIVATLFMKVLFVFILLCNGLTVMCR